MKRLSILLAGSALAVSAQAIDWVEVSESNSGSVFSIDVESIESSDISIIDEKDVENITVAMLREYPVAKDKEKEKDKKSDSAKTNAPKKDSIHHSEQQLLISCKDASYYRRAYVNYNADNKVIKSWQSEKPILTTKDFKITTPKTVGRTLIEQSCDYYEQAKLQSKSPAS